MGNDLRTVEILKEVQELNAWNGVTIFWSDFLACQEIWIYIQLGVRQIKSREGGSYFKQSHRMPLI